MKACPPLQLFQDELGRRAVPLSSLRHVLEWQLQADPEGASLEALLEAVTHAEEAPLPGQTPERAELPRSDIPGLELVEPRRLAGHLLHPETDDTINPCSNCHGTERHEAWCPVAPGQHLDPIQQGA